MQVPPPPRFRPVCGEIRWAHLTKSDWTPPRATSASKRAGMVFEDKAHLKLFDLFDDNYVKSPMFVFGDGASNNTRCIPDGYIKLSKTKVCLVEIKLSHTPDAWWQLRKLYGPLAKYVFGEPPLVLEIVKNFEPSTPFPEKVEVVYDIFAHVLNASPGDFGVLRWKL